MQATLHLSTLLSTAGAQPADAAQGAQDRLPSVDSHALLQGQKAVTIHHNGALYRLQATRLGKLILTN